MLRLVYDSYLWRFKTSIKGEQTAQVTGCSVGDTSVEYLNMITNSFFSQLVWEFSGRVVRVCRSEVAKLVKQVGTAQEVVLHFSPFTIAI